MKLPKGTIKVIVGDREKAEENQSRAQVGGKIFVPPYTVYEWDEEFGLAIHAAHSFSASTLRPKTNLASLFPYKWAPSALRDTVMWLETTGEVTLYSTLEIPNNG